MTTPTGRPRGLTFAEAFSWFMPGTPPEGECWEWQGGTRWDGYGRFKFSGEWVLAHRASYEIHKGPIPYGGQVLHDPVLCNNPSCVNPAHLRIGTYLDNNLDQAIAGTRSKGEGRPASKLTESDVRAIRTEYATGGVFYKELASRYGVSASVVGEIVNRKAWRHVP